MTPFGRYLEHLRRSRGLQQSQLAVEIGVNPCYISAIENGRKGPASPPILQSIINTLELSEDEERLFWVAVEESKLTLRIPGNTSTSEYRLVNQLWKKLGTLSEDQISVITTTLNMTGGSQRRAYRNNYAE